MGVLTKEGEEEELETWVDCEGIEIRPEECS